MNIAVAGATGLVGRKTLELMEEKIDKEFNLYLYASENSVGKQVIYNQKTYNVELLSKRNILDDKIDIIVFCAGGELAKIYVPFCEKNNIVVVEYSSVFRMKYPLIVMNVNDNIKYNGVLCNPNCSTIQSVIALSKIADKFKLKQVNYCTYQAVSGAGQKGLLDLYVHEKNKLNKFNYLINNNLIPQIGDVEDDGYTTEEIKMINETHKIFNDNNIDISSTCVRVPIDYGHSINIDFETQEDASLEDIEQCLKWTKNVLYLKNDLSMPISIKNTDFIEVSRLRKHQTKPNTFSMFVVADNLRIGSATNGVYILKKVMEEFDNDKHIV